MRRKGSNIFNQPISLKWKWGVLLFLAMILWGGLAFTIHHQQIKQGQESFIISQKQSQFNNIKNYLQRAQYPFRPRESGRQRDNVRQMIEQEDLFGLLHHFETDQVAIEVRDREEALLYASEDSPQLKLESSDQVQPYDLNGQEIFVRRDRLVSSVNGNELGSLTFYFFPPQSFNLADTDRGYQWRVPGLVLLALVVAFSLSHYFFRPLSYMIHSLDLVEEESLSDIRVRKPKSNDEWSDLSHHINKLLDKIDLYVTNQKQFVEDVSHELRTPLAIVEGHLKLLNRWGKDDTAILEESILASLQEMNRMKGLVQEMLDLSRADHVDVDYKDEVTEIYSTTRQVYSNFQLIHPDFNFYSDTEKADTSLYVRMFKNHFEQILIILLDNAVKYSTDRKEVHLSISQSFGQVEIAVQDFGEGMTEADQEKVFGRFYRVDKARSRNKGGNGLGLSIAQQLIHSYRGDIYVESVLGNGSIFYVNLPILQNQDLINRGKESKLSQSSQSLSAKDINAKVK